MLIQLWLESNADLVSESADKHRFKSSTGLRSKAYASLEYIIHVIVDLDNGETDLLLNVEPCNCLRTKLLKESVVLPQLNVGCNCR